MVRFVVEDYDSTSQNDLVGHYCLPLTSIQNGKEDLALRQKIGKQSVQSGLNSEALGRFSKSHIPLEGPSANHMTFVSFPSCSSPGYRHVPLLTKRGDVICSAGLFVHCMLIDASE